MTTEEKIKLFLEEVHQKQLEHNMHIRRLLEWINWYVPKGFTKPLTMEIDGPTGSVTKKYLVPIENQPDPELDKFFKTLSERAKYRLKYELYIYPDGLIEFTEYKRKFGILVKPYLYVNSITTQDHV